MLLIVGKNPMMSHHFQRARTVLKKMAKDPDRLLVVVDPRRTETAKIADIHLAIRPGTDALFYRAMISIILQRGLARSGLHRPACVRIRRDSLLVHRFRRQGRTGGVRARLRAGERGQPALRHPKVQPRQRPGCADESPQHPGVLSRDRAPGGVRSNRGAGRKRPAEQRDWTRRPLRRERSRYLAHAGHRLSRPSPDCIRPTSCRKRSCPTIPSA